MQHLTVVSYDPDWPHKYQEELGLIRPILRDNLAAAYHIGSTAVPGCAAKPIIDIMLAVKDLREVDKKASGFEALGYEYLGPFGIKGRRYLRKGGDERTHQIHIFQGNDWRNISRHLAFRDLLRSNATLRDEYSALKGLLAAKFPYDIEGYCNGKEGFVQLYENLAVQFFHISGIWEKLYLKACMVQGAQQLSPTAEAGSVGAVLLTDRGSIFTGVCLDTACSLGMCAERSAIAQMITQGESRIVKLAVVGEHGKVLMPCGACRELMMQLAEDPGKLEILSSYEPREVVSLEELLPKWWKEPE